MHAAWPLTAPDLIRTQIDLAEAAAAPWRPATRSPRIAACFVCFAEGGRAWAAAALGAGRRVVDIAVVAGTTTAPYRPGLMALREGALLEAAVRALGGVPDVLLVNATGRDHPRRAGLALHLGAVLGLPSAGVTDRPLVASLAAPVPSERGGRAPVVLGGDVVAYALRTRAGARPVIVHGGWRTDPEVAVDVVMSCLRRARTPEPLRRARRAARLARAGRTT